MRAFRLLNHRRWSRTKQTIVEDLNERQKQVEIKNEVEINQQNYNIAHNIYNDTYYLNSTVKLG